MQQSEDLPMQPLLAGPCNLAGASTGPGPDIGGTTGLPNTPEASGLASARKCEIRVLEVDAHVSVQDMIHAAINSYGIQATLREIYRACERSGRIAYKRSGGSRLITHNDHWKSQIRHALYTCDRFVRAADDYWTISKPYAKVAPALTKVLIRQDSPGDAAGIAIGSDSPDGRVISSDCRPATKAASRAGSPAATSAGTAAPAGAARGTRRQTRAKQSRVSPAASAAAAAGVAAAAAAADSGVADPLPSPGARKKRSRPTRSASRFTSRTVSGTPSASPAPRRGGGPPPPAWPGEGVAEAGCSDSLAAEHSAFRRVDNAIHRSYGDLAAAAGSVFMGPGIADRDSEGEDETSNTEAFHLRPSAAAPQARSGYATRAAGALPAPAAPLRGGPGFGWGGRRPAEGSPGGAGPFPTDYSNLRQRLPDAFLARAIERAESAEAESPPNTQLYALRSRATVATNVAAPGPRAQLQDRASPLPTFPAAASVAREATSEAMDLSESQGPIKKRLKAAAKAAALAEAAAAETAQEAESVHMGSLTGGTLTTAGTATATHYGSALHSAQGLLYEREQQQRAAAGGAGPSGGGGSGGAPRRAALTAENPDSPSSVRLPPEPEGAAATRRRGLRGRPPTYDGRPRPVSGRGAAAAELPLTPMYPERAPGAPTTSSPANMSAVGFVPYAQHKQMMAAETAMEVDSDGAGGGGRQAGFRPLGPVLRSHVAEDGGPGPAHGAASR